MDEAIQVESQIQGWRALRRHHQGALMLQERRTLVKWVIEGSSGDLVLPVEPSFARSMLGLTGTDELTLWMPAEDQAELHAAVSLSMIDRPESLEASDRWQGYHGKSSMSTWVRARIDGLKGDFGVLDGIASICKNPLGRNEYPLIRQLNADLLALAQVCKRMTALTIPQPQCVGVDPLGVDVRAAFGIVRLEFPPGIYASTPERAQAQLKLLLELAAHA